MPVFFFFNDTATTEIYTLSLHDALPISVSVTPAGAVTVAVLTRFPVADDFTVTETVKVAVPPASRLTEAETSPEPDRSEEHTSELQSQSNLVCRLLLEKNKSTLQLTSRV